LFAAACAFASVWFLIHLLVPSLKIMQIVPQ
jgi:hypothetical protein